MTKISTLANLVVVISADVARLQAGMAGAVGVVKRASRDIDELGKRLQTTGRNLTTFVTAPIIGLAIAGIRAASEIEEMSGKFDAVFKDMAADVRAWSAQHAAAINRSRFDLQGYAATLQDTFVPLGIARDQAATLSKAVTELGIDLASFNNAAEAETINLLTSALVGNHEAVRRFGVIITESTLKAKLLALGIKGGTQAASEQQKLLARLMILYESTADAQGDAARTSGSLANQWHGLMGSVKDLVGTLSKDLLPVGQQVIALIKPMVAWVAGLSEEKRRLYLQIILLAAAIGPLLIGLGFMARGLVAVGTVVGAVAKALRGMVTLVGGPWTIAILAAAGLAILLARNWDKSAEWIRAAWNNITSIFDAGVAAMKVAWLGVQFFWGVPVKEKLAAAKAELADALARWVETDKIALDTTLDLGGALAQDIQALLGSFGDLGAFVVDMPDKFGEWAAAADEAAKNIQAGLKESAEEGRDLQTVLKEMFAAAASASQAADQALGKTSRVAFVDNAKLVAIRQLWEGHMARGELRQAGAALAAMDLVKGVSPGAMSSPASTLAQPLAATVTDGPRRIDISGTVRHEGVNNRGELVAVVEQTGEHIGREIQRDQDRFGTGGSGRRVFR